VLSRVVGGGPAIGRLELTPRNFVDDFLGSPAGYIEGIYLEPEHRGRGHGLRLVAFAAKWFKPRGCKYMATDAEVANVVAQT